MANRPKQVKSVSPSVRDRIDAVRLIERLQRFALSDQSNNKLLSPEELLEQRKAYMTTAQVRAATDLLDRYLPPFQALKMAEKETEDDQLEVRVVYEKRPDDIGKKIDYSDLN